MLFLFVNLTQLTHFLDGEEKTTPDTRYKFKDLKVYGSTEWLADGQKKYRRVFDKGESTYIYSEFSFYNKRFDEDEWTANILLKGFSLDGEKKEICSITVEKKVSPEQNIIFVREGWGSESAGTFWKEGSYCWEAFIDEELVATANFYIYDVGVVSQTENKYLSIQKVRLYEGPDSGVAQSSRVYYTQFVAKETRYIWGEFSAKNSLNKAWYCELFYYFYNDAGQLKGRTSELVLIQPEQETFTITSGWGSDNTGTWFEDNYRLEIVFMDTLIGVVQFSTGDEFVEGETTLLAPGTNTFGVGVFTQAEEGEPASLQDALEQLNELIGLEGVKSRLHEYTKYLEFVKLRKDKGLEESGSLSLHAVFTGNPGTGKTTVARMLGQVYKKLGLLSKGHVHEVDRADIVGEYIGQTAPKVREAIKKAKGGILFIDEAYSLARSGDDSKDYGREVIEMLVKEMSNGTGDLAIIVAGYPREMDNFLQSNPGLKSRFTQYYKFTDYIPQELWAIAELAIKKRGVTLGEGVYPFLYGKLVEAYRQRDRSFGNARYVYSLVDEARVEMGLRLMKEPEINKLTTEQLSTLLADDFQKVFEQSKSKKPDIPQDAALLQEAMEELKNLIGMNNVKAEVNELIKLVRFYQEVGKDIMNKFSLHSVFLGNPGTGKTTVARILGKVFKALGILERGEMVEVDRQALVAGYVGQTAIKTAELIEQARGSVLFIDEAYSLASGGSNDFGQEAIETLLKRMEDMRGEIIVIVAGYPDRMNEFLESNPGLKSRFDRKFAFPDYAPNEMQEIARVMLLEEGIKAEEQAMEHLQHYFGYLYSTRNKYFGNGRAVRKVIEKAIKNQHLRLANMSSEQRTIDMLSQLTLADVQEFIPNNDSLLEGGGQGRMGFK